MDDLSAAGQGVYGDLLNVCIWNKSNAGMGSLYRSKHEMVFVYRAGSEAHLNNVELGRHGRHRTNVWDYAPARMCAIHAIELFLNAFLRHEGISHGQIRGRMHNLADPSFVTTLKLRKKTAQHLRDMSEKREYLISRYAPEMASQHTEVNRLMATSEEIMQKVCKHLNTTDEIGHT